MTSEPTSKWLAARLSSWVLWSVKHAQAIVIATFLLTVLAGYYTAQVVSVNTDTDSLIDPKAEFRQVYGRFKEAFPQLSDTMVFVVRAPAAETADAAVDLLIDALDARPNLFQGTFAPTADAFFLSNGLLFRSPEDLQNLTDQLADAQPFLAKLAEDPSLRGLFDMVALAVDEAGDDPEAAARLAPVLQSITDVLSVYSAGDPKLLSWQGVLDPDAAEGVTRFVTVQPVLDFERLQPAKPAIEEAQAAADAVVADLPGQAIIEITGKIPLNFEELRSVSDGAATAGLLSFIFVALVLGFGLRSWRLVLAALTMLVIGLTLTAGFAMAAIGSFNMISVAFAVLFIGLAVDFAIHFCLRFQEARERGHPHVEAMGETASSAGVALAICAPTTALAFFAFTPTAYAGLSQLGMIAGAGMVIAFVLSVTYLPALLTLLPLPDHPGGFRTPRPVGARFAANHARSVLGVAAVAAIAAVWVVPSVRFDPDQLNLKDERAASVVAFKRLLEDTETSPYTVHALRPSLEQAVALGEEVKSLPEVGSVVTLQSFVPNDQDLKLDLIDQAALLIDPVFFAFPQEPPTDEEARQSLVAAEATLAASSIPVAQELASELARLAPNDLSASDLEELDMRLLSLFPVMLERLEGSLSPSEISLEELPRQLARRYVTEDGLARVEIRPAENLNDQGRLAHFVNTLAAEVTDVTGPPVQMVRSAEIVAQSMFQATLWAALLIGLCLFVIFRRVRDVALVAVPLALAALYTLSATVLFGLPFNFANVIVLPLLIGLGVDGGIHILMRAKEPGDAAVLETSTPKAVFVSAVTTIGSFGTLAVSPHVGTASMGMLLTISVVLTLFCMLLVLPALLHQFKIGS